MLNVKICGLNNEENIQEVLDLRPDYIGMIFYPGTPRYLGKDFDLARVKQWTGVKKTAVFVNEQPQPVKQILEDGGFDAVQLHGQESPEYCKKLRKAGVSLIKAFGIGPDFDWKQLEAYQETVDYFLFDSKSPGHGGSGQVFNWEILDKYRLDKPYFLSGGLSPENIQGALSIQDTRLHALDLNSKFELRPGIKDIPLLNKILTQIRQCVNIR